MSEPLYSRTLSLETKRERVQAGQASERVTKVCVCTYCWGLACWLWCCWPGLHSTAGYSSGCACPGWLEDSDETEWGSDKDTSTRHFTVHVRMHHEQVKPDTAVASVPQPVRGFSWRNPISGFITSGGSESEKWFQTKQRLWRLSLKSRCFSKSRAREQFEKT